MTIATSHSNSTGLPKSVATVSSSLEDGLEAAGTRSRLRVKACAPDDPVFGQAFWDVSQESIVYHLVPHKPYDSYIQGESFRIDTDSTGRPVYFEMGWGASNHLIVNGLRPPIATPSGVRFLDLRIRFHELSVTSTCCHSETYIEFNDIRPLLHLAIGPGMIIGLGPDERVCSLWIVKAIADPSGSLQARWRSKAWQAVRRRSLAGAERAEAGPISPDSSPKVC